MSNLRQSRIENFGFKKLRTIAKTIGLPPEVEFEESVGKSDLYTIYGG